MITDEQKSLIRSQMEIYKIQDWRGFSRWMIRIFNAK